nr:helix-turn-helix transcriptional regulator [uncultured Oscillibacter sp.]
MQYQRIRELRKEQNLTQREMAELLRISLSSYSRYENGTADIPLAVLCGLALIYHTSLDYIAELTDQRIPHKRAN